MSGDDVDMMLVRRGEKVIRTFDVRTKRGDCAMHLSNKRIVLEEHGLGCIMCLELRDMHSCTLVTDSGKSDTVTLRHNNGSYVEARTADASILADVINSTLAQYKSALISIVAVSSNLRGRRFMPDK